MQNFREVIGPTGLVIFNVPDGKYTSSRENSLSTLIFREYINRFTPETRREYSNKQDSI